MLNERKLKVKMVEKNLNVEMLAEKIGLNKSSFYRKLKENGEKFLVREIDAIARELELDKESAMEIFFSQYVA